jgi:hypothetical protein
MILAVAAFWLVSQRLIRDVRAPLVPPMRLVRLDRSHLSFATSRRA